MRHRLIAAGFGLFALTAGASAQTVTPATQVPHRQPRPTATDPAPGTPAAALDLDATRKRFDANVAKQNESDRKRNSRLESSMRSICSGCGDAPATKPVKARKARPAAAVAPKAAD